MSDLSTPLILEASGDDALDMLLAKQIADKLNTVYPGYLWAVNTNRRTGMVDLRCLNLSGAWGYRLKMSRVQEDPGLACCTRAAGEILERYRQSRRGKDEQALHDAPIDFAGRMTPDL